MRSQESAFGAALSSGDVPAAVRAVLELDETLRAWSADTLQSDELDQGRAVLRSMIVRLGGLAEVGARDPRALVGPFVDALLETRASARKAGRYEDADAVRDHLLDLGIEVRDTPAGTEWDLKGDRG